MIFLRTHGGDESLGVSNFVSIPQPIGVADGDLIIVGICLPDTGFTVEPPDEEWTPVAQTDETRTGSLVCFYRFAMNEPARWVFSLASAAHPNGTYAVGGVLVYGGVDGFEPVESFVSQTSPLSAAQLVPAITASENGGELVLLLAADAAATFTPLAGYQAAVARAPVGSGTFEAHHLQKPAAGVQVATTIALSLVAHGACIALTLRPSAGTLSVNDVRERIIAAFPQGVEDVYDLTPSGDYFRYFQAIATHMKAFAFDLVDLVRREIVPQFTRYKLPSWERIFGLETTKTTKLGTIPERQAQVVSSWRAAAGQGSSLSAIQAVLGPLLGYLPTTTVQVLEAQRLDLQLRNSYDLIDDVAIPAGTTTLVIAVNDGGKVSVAGATLTLLFDGGDLSQYTFQLIAPDGTTKTWNRGWKTVPLRLWGREFAGARIQGTWHFVITNGSGVANKLYGARVLFVEGIARGQSTGGAVYHWGVLADAAHVGENGQRIDLETAERAVRKMRFAHTRAGIVRSVAPYPGVSSGAHAAIPGQCIPNV